jgi:phosphatidylserine decarboxylase
MKNNLFIIAQSGWIYVGLSFGAFILFFFLEFALLTLVALTLTLLFLFLFRNPEREFLHFEEESIVSPVDGSISAIIELENDKEYAYRVDIVSDYKDLSILRAPINATVSRLVSYKGARIAQGSKLFKALNENSEIVFTTQLGAQIKIQHRLTQSFAPLEINLFPMQKIFKSSRYGMMQSGVTSIYLPSNVRLDIQLAQELKASETLIGFLS